MQNHFIQSAVAIVVSFFLLVLADFVPFWMPMMGDMTVLLIVTVLLLVWGSYVMSETAVDEREIQLKIQSGRVAYLAGLGVLALALIMQGFAHAIDPWIPVALVTMVLVKFLTRLALE